MRFCMRLLVLALVLVCAGQGWAQVPITLTFHTAQSANTTGATAPVGNYDDATFVITGTFTGQVNFQVVTSSGATVAMQCRQQGSGQFVTAGTVADTYECLIPGGASTIQSPTSNMTSGSVTVTCQLTFASRQRFGQLLLGTSVKPTNGQCLVGNGTTWNTGACTAAGAVTTTGSPVSGNIAQFSGAATITNAPTTGTGSVVLQTSPTITTPTISSGNMTFSTLGMSIVQTSVDTFNQVLLISPSVNNKQGDVDVYPKGVPVGTQARGGFHAFDTDISGSAGASTNNSFIEMVIGSDSFVSNDAFIDAGKFGTGTLRDLHIGIANEPPNVIYMTFDRTGTTDVPTNARVGIGTKLLGGQLTNPLTVQGRQTKGAQGKFLPDVSGAGGAMVGSSYNAQAYYSLNAEYMSGSTNWTARNDIAGAGAVPAGIMSFQSVSNGISPAGISFAFNTGLTNGATFTPTYYLTIAPAGAMILGTGDGSGTLAKNTFRGPNADGVTSNVTGSGLTVQPGLNSGNAVPASINIQGGALGTAAGATVHTAVSRHTVNTSKILTNNSAIAIVNATVASNTVAMQSYQYGVEVFNGTDLQVEAGFITCTVINKAGVFSGNTCTKSGNTQSVSVGTLTVTFAISAANPAVVSVNANSSLTPSAGYPRIVYEVVNFSQNDIAIQ